MDEVVDPDIIFDEAGVCNHCKRYESLSSDRISFDPDVYSNLIESIKKRGKNSKYDCVVGVSGGVDSSYVASLAVKEGLRVLAVHVDNGWNSELAVKNIELLINNLDIPLKTVVLNWEEFRKLQIAFLRAGTPDGEIPTDHAIYASLWNVADQLGVKTILSGMNFQTESIYVPSWSYGHMDSRYLLDISKKNGGPAKLMGMPTISLPRLAYYTIVKRIKSVSILNYLPYVKQDVMEFLIDDIGWKPYEGKHFESSYTKFYQGYVLPKQFQIDKRKGHLSDLIYSKQISREEALRQLESDPVKYEELDELKRYVATKFEISVDDLEKIINSGIQSRDNYDSFRSLIAIIKDALLILRRWGIYPK